MTPQEFIQKWQGHALTERASAQSHFNDICKLVGEKNPIEADRTGEDYAFEKGVSKTGGGDGFADVWKRGHFAWEYKKSKSNLDKALEQLTRYASALENPPLHVACDTNRFKIVTAWTNTVPKVHEFTLAEIGDPANLTLLRALFTDPQKLRPQKTRASLTKEAADKFSAIVERLQHRNPDREAVAHFVNQLVFCFFAEDVKLLPEDYFTKLLHTASKRPKDAKKMLDGLFAAMDRGGTHGIEDIAHFNGGLFDGRPSLELDHGDIGLLAALGSMDWSLIDPMIFGTLFERFLDPDKRAQIGAHYTDETKIMMIVEPVIMRPLAGGMGAGEGADRGAAGRFAQARKRQGDGPRAEAAGGGGGGARAVSRPAARGAHPRPRLRLRQFSLSGAARRQGHREPCHPRNRGDGPFQSAAAGRAGNSARH